MGKTEGLLCVTVIRPFTYSGIFKVKDPVGTPAPCWNEFKAVQMPWIKDLFSALETAIWQSQPLP